jgi:flagellar P-ring protein precursor FlgI
MKGRGFVAFVAVLVAALVAGRAWADDVRIRDMGRFLGWRDNALVGYGIVTGLAGSGDSPRNEVTRQALKNVLSRLGANVTPDEVQSRNVAAVIITATLPPVANVGDHIDVTVSSIGDARSLVGGTLLMAPLLGPDQHPYALAQGALVVGGYRFDANFSREQKNYPASGVVPNGATVETGVTADLVGAGDVLTFALSDPDPGNAERVVEAINAAIAPGLARVQDAGTVVIDARGGGDLYQLISRVDDLTIVPESLARVVVNERSGTVVAGGGVRISSVVISQGDIRVSVVIDGQGGDAAQYGAYGGDLRSLVVADTRLNVSTPPTDAVVRFPDTTVADLVEGLSRVHVDTRGVISVLQAIKAAGALHAEIIVQ